MTIELEGEANFPIFVAILAVFDNCPSFHVRSSRQLNFGDVHLEEKR
jgi:hypothetical protein